MAAAIELGKPMRDSVGEMDRAAETLAVAAAHTRQLGGELLARRGLAARRRYHGDCFRAPVGTVLAVTPFNAPVNLLAHKVAASFAAGNGTIVKPPAAGAGSEHAVRRSSCSRRACRKKGSRFSTVTAAVASALAASNAVKAVAFTGSASAGASIASTPDRSASCSSSEGTRRRSSARTRTSARQPASARRPATATRGRAASPCSASTSSARSTTSSPRR